MAHKAVDFAIQLAAILFSISFHESAHAWSALQFGDTTARDQGRISLNPLRHIDPVGSILVPLILYIFSGLIFGAAKPTPVDLRNTRNPRLANLVVSAAGPVSNFLLAAVGIVLLRVIGAAVPGSLNDLQVTLVTKEFTGGAIAPIVYLLFFFALVNTMLGVFNLIPVPPLDGSGVALSLAPSLRGLYVTIAPFGLLILIFLITTPFLSRLFIPFQALVWNLIFRGIR